MIANRPVVAGRSRSNSRDLVLGGGGGIRTHGRVTPSSVFKTDPLNHSGTPPVAEMISKVAETIPREPA